MGTKRLAGSLAKSHQNGVDTNPVSCREFLAQGHLGLKGRLCFHVAPDIHDPVNMGIHTDCRLLKGNCHHQISSFSPHPGQPGKRFNIIRDSAAKLFHGSWKIRKIFCLILIKTNRVYELGKSCLIKTCQTLKVRCLPEQPC